MIKKIFIGIIAFLMITISIAGATAYSYYGNPYLSGSNYRSNYGSYSNWGNSYRSYSNWGNSYRPSYGYNNYGYGNYRNQITSGFHLTNHGFGINTLGVSLGVGYPYGSYTRPTNIYI